MSSLVSSPVILFGGLTWAHERLIEAVLRRAGHRCVGLPEPTQEAHEIGKEFCGNNLCNPVYYTVGNLLLYLRSLEAGGLTRRQIIDDYAFFTAGSQGPCRFGMYEAEFRSALREAGYDGFRVLLFQQDHGVKANAGESLRFTVDWGMDALHAFVLGDLINEFDHRLRPYAVDAMAAQDAVREMTLNVARALENAQRFELFEHAPQILRSILQRHMQSRLYRFLNTWGKVFDHLRGDALTRELRKAMAPVHGVEVDWLRLRPVVKVIGEFWAQQTESAGNYQMFRFLEGEGAEVSVEALSNWVLYLLHQFRYRAIRRHSVEPLLYRWRRPLRAAKASLVFHLSMFAFDIGERIYLGHHRRLARALGVEPHALPSQSELARLADPNYRQDLRGGEGHLEVAKNLYYSRQRLCHMTLSLKPFGCMPSLQSDAVQAGLAARDPEITFLSIETSAEGSIHAYSRVQMALSEAHEKARRELDETLARSRMTMAEARRHASADPALRDPLCAPLRRPGIASTAANMALVIAEKQRTTHIPEDRSRKTAGSFHKNEKENSYAGSTHA